MGLSADEISQVNAIFNNMSPYIQSNPLFLGSFFESVNSQPLNNDQRRTQFLELLALNYETAENAGRLTENWAINDPRLHIIDIEITDT